MEYNKPCTTVADQVEQLKQRGLLIEDEPSAVHYLSNISYYRLAGYWWPMQSDKINHTFKAGSKFSDVISLYNFDRELRLILFDVIERIEIALRTKMIYHLSHEFDPWWFQNHSLFVDIKELVKSLSSLQEEVERSKDVFIKDHNSRYKLDKRFPPAWKTLELTSLGGLSKLYGNLKASVKSKDKIAEEFLTVNHTFLPSWLLSTSQIRNICAHHGRLWNKNLPTSPKLMTNPPGKWLNNVPTDSTKVYLHICCMKYLLDAVSPGHSVKEKLIALLNKYSHNIDLKAIGFLANWQDEPLWST